MHKRQVGEGLMMAEQESDSHRQDESREGGIAHLLQVNERRIAQDAGIGAEHLEANGIEEHIASDVEYEMLDDVQRVCAAVELLIDKEV